MKTLTFPLALLLGCSASEPIDTSDLDDPTGNAWGEDSEPEVIDCTGVEAELSTLSLQELADMLTERGAGQDAFRLINVHLPHSDDILGTDADVPFDDVDELMATLGDPGTKAVVYCRTGALSNVAGHSLVDAGYCNLFDLPDGYQDWEDEGFAMAE